MNAGVHAEPLAPYRAAYEAARHAGSDTQAFRAAAFARFTELGFPAAREEAWKYTSLRRLESRKFALPDHAASHAARPAPPDALAEHVVVLTNGVLQPGFSTLDRLPAGLRVRSLEQARCSLIILKCA